MDTLPKINKENGDVLDGNDIKLIDTNFEVVKTAIDSITSGTTTSLTYSEFVI
jgi:hypothetical protein